jgi:hypothetical protein
MSKKLQKQIAKKLDQLQELLDSIDEARIVNSEEPETWDSDVLYDLAANLKEALQLLEDKLSDKLRDDLGQPLILEAGLCSLMDSYQEEEEDYD